MAVFWPKLTACLPAIADLVSSSTTGTTKAHCCGLQCGWMHNRSGSHTSILVLLPPSSVLSQGFDCSDLKVIFSKFRGKIVEEDEAEETGDGVWRGNILCGCVLTISDVGPSPT